MSLIKAKDSASNIGSSTQPFEKIYANNLPKKIVVSGDANGTGTFDDNGNMSLSLAVEQNTTGISFKGVLNGENLDNVLEDGYYIQRLDGGAQPNLNYPIALGGMLFVISYRNSQDVIEFTFQQYQSTSGLFFTRSYNKTSNKFSDWTSGGEITFTDIVPVGTIARFPYDDVNDLPDDWQVIDETYDANKVMNGDISVAKEINNIKSNILQDSAITLEQQDFSGWTSDYGANINKISGKSIQDTTNGYQLLNPDLYNKDLTNNGVSFARQPDGKIKVTGTLTDTKIATFYLGEYIDILEDGQTYKYSSDTNLGTLAIKYNDGTINYFSTITVDKSKMTSIRPYLQFNEKNPNKKTIYQPILNVGSSVKPWEQYTGTYPSPNPSFPQPIYSVLDKADETKEPYIITSFKSNMLDAEHMTLHNARNFKIENHGYTIYVESNGGYGGADYTLEENLVKSLHGKKIKLKCDKMEKKPNGTIQVEIAHEKTEREYHLFVGTDKETEEFVIKDDVIGIKIQLRPLNNINTQEEYQSIYVEGLRLILADEQDKGWDIYNYDETNLSTIIKPLCSLPDGTKDLYDYGITYRNVGNVTFDGSEDELWNIEENTTLGKRYSIKLTPDGEDSNTASETSMNTNFTLGSQGATFAERNKYTIADSSLFVSLTESETLEEFRQYLSQKPMQLLYKLKKQSTEQKQLPIIPTFYQYTNLFQANRVKTNIVYSLRSKADYAISLIENLTKAMTVKSIDGTTSLNVSEILLKTMPIINGISFYDYDVSDSIRELSKYYPTVSLQSETEENTDEQFNQLGDVSQEFPKIENITKEEDNNENK